MAKCGERINLDSGEYLENTSKVLETSIQSLIQFIINMKEFPPNGYVEFKWKSTLNVSDHKTLENKASCQSSMMTELMMQLYTLAVVENKRGCAAMCDAVSKSDVVFKVAALK